MRTCLHRCTVHGLMLGPTIIYQHRHWMTEPVVHDLHPLIWMHLMALIRLEGLRKCMSAVLIKETLGGYPKGNDIQGTSPPTPPTASDTHEAPTVHSHLLSPRPEPSAAHNRSSADVGSAHCQDDQVPSTLPPDQEPTHVNPASTSIQPYPNLLPSLNAHPGGPGVNSPPQHLLDQYGAHAFPEALQQDRHHQVHPYQGMQVMYDRFSHPMPMPIYYGGPQHQTMYGAPMQTGPHPHTHYWSIHHLPAHPPYKGGPYPSADACQPPPPPRN